MDTDRFAELTQIVETGSRRGVVRALTGGSLALLGPHLGPSGAGAKKKGKKKKKKQGPSLALAYACPGPPESILSWLTISRVAQVFVAGESGSLRRIEFLVDSGDDAGDYVVQLLRVFDGVPSHTAVLVLAGITIPDADVPQGESTLIATFNGPELAAGTEYAAAIGRLGSPLRLGNFSGTGNVCAGQTFSAQGGVFTESGGIDTVVSVFVD